MNTLNWTLWLLLTMTYCALTYNPIYQLLLLVIIAAVTVSKRQPLGTYIKMGLLVSALPLFVNIFLVHHGNTVIYTIPPKLNLLGLRIPALVFSGPITLESTLTGVIMAVFITNMLIAFQVFNNATSPDAILRLIPSTLPGVGLVSSIALRFIPTVVRDYSSISDAQMSRGVKINSGSLRQRMKNQLNILAPTVLTTLERGFNLAESMAARGYAGERTKYKNDTWTIKEHIIQLAFICIIILLFYLKYLGYFEYWPYVSALTLEFSPAAAIPIAVLMIPVFIKDECSRD